MPFMDRAISLIVSHGPYIWTCWLLAAYLVGRYGGLVGIIIGRSMTAAMVVLIDFQILHHRILQGGIAAPDGVEWSFIWNTALHVILINTLLLPVNICGWLAWKKRCKRRGQGQQGDRI